jgi:hypothetical protein
MVGEFSSGSFGSRRLIGASERLRSRDTRHELGPLHSDRRHNHGHRCAREQQRGTAGVWRPVLVVAGLAIINAAGVYAQLVADHVGERGAALSLHHLLVRVRSRLAS